MGLPVLFNRYSFKYSQFLRKNLSERFAMSFLSAFFYIKQYDTNGFLLLKIIYSYALRTEKRKESIQIDFVRLVQFALALPLNWNYIAFKVQTFQ